MVAATPQLLARLAALVVGGVVVQTAAISQLPVAGANADLSPLLVMAIGLLCGALAGACFGFGVGLFVDVALLQTLGVSSIVLLTIGYLAGRWRESFDITSSLVPPLLTGALALFGAAMFAAIQLMLGVEAPVSLLVVREIVVKGILAMLLAVPFYPLVRLILRSALVEDTGRRRKASLVPIRTS